MNTPLSPSLSHASPSISLESFRLKRPLSIIMAPLEKQYLSEGAFTLITHYEPFDQATGANILKHTRQEERF